MNKKCGTRAELLDLLPLVVSARDLSVGIVVLFSEPKKYSVYPTSCLNFDGYISFESNLTLFSCFERCNKDSR